MTRPNPPSDLRFERAYRRWMLMHALTLPGAALVYALLTIALLALGQSAHAAILGAAGTGALGLEALSRGARQACFVEADSDVAACLGTNLDTLGANGRVHRQAALDFLAGAPETPFDLVFLDPPFRQGHADDACRALEARGWLGEQAWIYLEVEHELTPAVPDHWQLHREQTRALWGFPDTPDPYSRAVQ